MRTSNRSADGIRPSFLSIQAQDFIEDSKHSLDILLPTIFLSIQAQDFIEEGNPAASLLYWEFLSIQAQDFIEDISIFESVAAFH